MNDDMPPGGENSTPPGEENPAPPARIYGQPGQQPGSGQPGYGAPQNPPPGGPTYGSSGQPSAQPYGQPGYGAPQNPPPGNPFGQPGPQPYGQPGYGPPGYGQPGPATPPGGGAYSPPGYQPYGQPSYGQPGYGQPGPATPPGGAYGPAGYQPYGQPGYGGWQVAPAPGGVPLRPLSLGDIFNGAVNLARRNPAATFGLAAIVMTIYAVVLAVLHRFYGTPQTVAGQTATQQQITHLIGGGVSVAPAAALATELLALVADAVLTGLLSMVIGRGMLGHKTTLPEAWRAGRPGAVVATSALLLVLGVVPPGIIALVVFALAVAHVTPLAVLVGVLGGLATVVYEVLLYVRLRLALPALVLERVSPVASIRRSWQLSRGSFWRLFGILLLTSVVVGIATDVLLIPFNLIQSAVAGSAPTAVPALIVTAVGIVVAWSITTPMAAGVNVLLYADMRMRREGLDLMLRDAAQNRTLTGDEFAALWQPAPAPPASPRA